MAFRRENLEIWRYYSTLNGVGVLQQVAINMIQTLNSHGHERIGIGNEKTSMK
jgi:hypothetical protein